MARLLVRRLHQQLNTIFFEWQASLWGEDKNEESDAGIHLVALLVRFSRMKQGKGDVLEVSGKYW